MKIAFIGLRGIPAYYSGIERRVEELAVRMAEAGHEVFVYCRDYHETAPNRPNEYKGVKLIYLPTIQSKHLDTIVHTLLASVHSLFKDYDIIHYQAPGPSTLSWVPKFFKRKTKIIATYNSKDQFHQKWGWLARAYLKWGEYLICKIPDKTIVLSKVLKQEVKEKYGKEAVYIPNGAGIKKTQESERLNKWGLEKDKYVLTVNRLVKHKGLHYLIQAFKELDRFGQIPRDFKLVIVGGSELLHTDQYEKFLKKETKDNQKIIFTGTQKGDFLAELFSNAYLYVQPSEAEGFSMATIEAMGCGRPVLVSNIRENKEVLGEFNNKELAQGSIFLNKNVADLMQKLKKLLEDKELADKLGARNREFAQENYNWDKIAERHLDVYKEILGR